MGKQKSYRCEQCNKKIEKARDAVRWYDSDDRNIDTQHVFCSVKCKNKFKTNHYERNTFYNDTFSGYCDLRSEQPHPFDLDGGMW